jgi:outer membrane assembly lipoprotein YfiO
MGTKKKLPLKQPREQREVCAPYCEPQTKEEQKKEREVLHKPIKDLSVDELRLRLTIDTKNGYENDKLKVIDQLVILSTDQPEVQQLRLERADIYFDEGMMKEAARYYREYIKLYPGSKDRDYAEYKRILCNFYAQLTPPHDQTKTTKTLEMITSYLDQENVHQAYRDEVRKIQTTCYNDLFEYEKGIFNFYAKQHNIKAADARLKHMQKTFETLHTFDAECLELEAYLAHLQGNTELLKEKTLLLETKFPEYMPSMLLVHTNRKQNYVHRF